MQTIFSVLFRLGLIFAIGGGVFSVRTMAESIGTLDYSLDARLLYLDRFEPKVFAYKSPLARLNMATDQGEESSKTSRAAGLSMLRIGMDWHPFAESGLFLVVRPDALSALGAENDEIAFRQETDTRAGNVYFDNAQIRLLDAYQIYAKLGPHFRLGLGVWEKFSQDWLSFRPILEFGLRVRFPEKFFGMGLQAQTFSGLPTADRPSGESSGYIGELFVLKGTNDRADRVARSSNTDDEGFVAKDAHYGAGLVIARVDRPWNRAGLAIAGLESDIYAPGTNRYSEDVNRLGTRQTIWMQAYDQFEWTMFEMGSKLCAELRMATEKFKGNELYWKTRRHYNLSMTYAGEFIKNNYALTGFHMGSNWFSDDDRINGQQIDLGYMTEFSKVLSLMFMVSDEARNRKTAGVEAGAFSVDNQAQRRLQRFALELRYAVF